MKLIGEYDMKIAVGFNKTAIMLNHGGIEQSEYWFENAGDFCEDNGFIESMIPKEAGIYNCKVEHWFWSGDGDCDWEFRIIESKRIN